MTILIALIILTGILGWIASPLWWILTAVFGACLLGIGSPIKHESHPVSLGTKTADEIMTEQLINESLQDYILKQQDNYQAMVDDANIRNAVNQVVYQARLEAEDRGLKITRDDVRKAEERARQVLSQKYYGRTFRDGI